LPVFAAAAAAAADDDDDTILVVVGGLWHGSASLRRLRGSAAGGARPETDGRRGQVSPSAAVSAC